MSIQKAFELLQKELGSNFKYNTIENFKRNVMNTSGILNELIKTTYPNAKYIDFTVAWDSINRINSTYNYQVIDENGTLLFDRDILLNQKNYDLNSIMHDTLEELVADCAPEEYEVDHLEKGQFYYQLDLDTMDYEEIDHDGNNNEDDEDEEDE